MTKGLRYIGCVTNQKPETSGPIIYGMALSTPAHVVTDPAAALLRYQKRIGTRWRAHDTMLQAILTIAWLEAGAPPRTQAPPAARRRPGPGRSGR